MQFPYFSLLFSGGLSKDEIENMVREAEANAADDKVKKDRIEASNQVHYITQSSLLNAHLMNMQGIFTIPV